MSDPVNDLYAKLGRALAAVGKITKDKTAKLGSYSYSYTDLNTVLHTVKEALSDQGLSMIQPIMPVDDQPGFFMIGTTIIDTASGESLGFPGPIFKVVSDPQAIGSAVTYGRRYALTSLFSLEVDDDDGAQAHRAATRPQQRTGAEAEIRRMVAEMQDDEKADYMAEFKATYKSTLTNLAESQHADALAFTKQWVDARKPFDTDPQP